MKYKRLFKEELPSEINEFLKQIGLDELEEEGSYIALIRFKELLQNYIKDEYAVEIIIYLLYKAKFELDSLDENEIEELLQIVNGFKNNKQLQEDDSEKKDKKKSNSPSKKSVVTTLVASALLGGIGGLLLAGLFYGIAYLSNDDWKDSKKELTDLDSKEKIEKGEVPKEKVEKIKKKPKKDPKEIKVPEKKGFFNKLKDKIKTIKDKVVNRAKSVVKAVKGDYDKDNFKQKSDKYKKQKPETKKDVDKTKPEIIRPSMKNDENPKSDIHNKDKKDKKLKPDEYKKKFGKCPEGWFWDKEKKSCVKNKKQESYSKYYKLF